MDLIETVDPHPTKPDSSGVIPVAGIAASRTLAPDQLRLLLEVHLDLEPLHLGGDLSSQLVQRVAGVLAAKAAIAVRASGGWTIGAESDPHPAIASVATAGHVLDRVAGAPIGARTERWLSGDHLWTLVGCGTRPSAVLLLQGDWMRAAPALSLLTRNLRLAWQAHVSGGRADRRRLAQQLARSLARVRGSQTVWNAVVEKMAQAVDARTGALAVPDSTERHLQIVSTYGYPRELVEHLRIDPGAGVVGAVFQSGRALYVPGRGALPEGRRRRPRYATDSFVAVPVGPAREPLGVVCVTDRRDGQPFSRDDVSTLRAMAAPAALALGRERALAQAENYAHAAAIDPLSGAFNRRYFHARLDEELQRSRRHQLSLTLLMIDIDDFKSINDSFGHLAGDTVIRDIAEILRRSVRIFDVCARFGGEEFAIIMPGSMAESAAKVADRIRERIEAYRPFDRALDAMRVTASVGLAESSVGMPGRELIARADYALYRAKRDGKNRVRTLGPDETIHPSGSKNLEVRTTKDSDGDEGP
jgi:diguanylate cyclase (GGDEF)-like protein